jgi:hypothetical protein
MSLCVIFYLIQFGLNILLCLYIVMTTYKLRHKTYYYKTRRYTDSIKRLMARFPIPLSVYEQYIDDDMEFVDLESAYLAIKSYTEILRLRQNINEQFNNL